MEKKIYEEPTVQKVEFDFKTRIAKSNCEFPAVLDMDAPSNPGCMN